MSKVYAPSIFITTNYDVAKQFAEGTKISELKDDTGSLLISNENNKYLQSFEYSYGYADKGNPRLVLSFVDVDNDFENSFLNQGVAKKLLTAGFEMISKAGRLTKGFTDNLSNILRSKFKIYFTFGVGGNSNDWAGPYVGVLMKTEVDINSNGLRVYRYTFMPTNTFFFRPPLQTAPENPNEYQDLSFLFVDAKTYVQDVKSNKDINNFHKCIRELLKNYIAKVSNTKPGNVICLLPELNKYAKEYINSNLTSRLQPGKDSTNLENAAELTINCYKDFGIDVYIKDSNCHGWGDTFNELYYNPQNEVNPQIMDKYLEGTNLKKKVQQWYEPDFILKLEATTQNKSNEDKKINVPDWWLKVQEINKGYSTVCKDYPSYITAFQENDIRYLRLFKKHGLIEDDSEPCTIVGNYQFILDTLYGNQTDYNKIMQYVSIFKFEQDDDLESKINNPSYKKDLIAIKFKHKNNSSFNEKIVLDELNYNGNLSPESFEAMKNSLNLLAETDIPIFSNNLRNGNVLSLSLESSDNYTAATLHAVREDRERFLYKLILENSDQLFKSSGMLTPDELAEITSVYNAFKEFDQPLDPEDLRRLQEGDGNWESYKMKDKGLLQTLFPGWQKEVKLERPTEPQKQTKIGLINKEFDSPVHSYERIDDSKYREELKAFENQEKTNQRIRDSNKNSELAKVLNMPNAKELTWLSLAMTRKLGVYKNEYGKLPNVDSDSLFTLALLMIAYNKFVQPYATVEMNPAIKGANKKTLQGKVFDYLYRFNTTINIKTLPYFHISNPSFIRKPAFLYSKKIQPIRSTNNLKATPDQVFDFFSGVYTIQGFKHVINGREMHSEFTLFRDLPTSDDSQFLGGIKK